MVMTVLLIIFIIYGIKLGIFSSNKELVIYIRKFGFWAPFIFILIQMIQVIFPIIPGGASCLAGTLAFGGLWGFIYNYIGLCMGSVFVFLLSRKYGYSLIEKLFKKETINKYIGYIQNKKFEKIFFWGIFLPGPPDDLLCYVSGVSSMTLKKFVLIILLGKPLALIGYSVFADYFPLLFS